MSQNKRKASSQEPNRPSKKQQTSKKIKVRHLDGVDIVKPVIANAPGTIVPPKLDFTPYTRDSTSGTTNLLLHSSTHDTIDYTAVDSSTLDSNEQHLKHYVAIFDPSKNRMEITEARKMTVKSHVRQYQQEHESSDEEPAKPAYYGRAALTEAFGSKKSRKAAATMAENRLLAGTVDSNDPLAKAIFSAAPDDVEPTLENATAGQTTKPLPPHNPSAQHVKDAYPFSTLVQPSPFATTLNAMPIAHWTHKLNKKQQVGSIFRFVAHRIIFVGRVHLESPNDTTFRQNFQLLKYIEGMLQIHKYIASVGINRKILAAAKWPEKTIQDGIGLNVVQGIYEHFFSEGRITNTSLTRLRTYILALTLHIPPGLATSAGAGMLATDPSDIFMDLAIETPVGTKWFRELGCKVESATEAEVQRWGLNKLAKREGKKAGKVKVAKLRLPLDFPKISSGRALKSRR